MNYERIDDSPQFDGECRKSHEMRYRIASSFTKSEDSILDAGCGTGYGMKFFDKENQAYFGLDKNPLDRPVFRYFDFETLEIKTGVGYPTEWDVFVGLEIIEHLNDEGVKNFVRMAIEKTNKWIIVSTPIVANSNPYHKQQFKEEDILELFKDETWEHYQTVYQGKDDRYGIFIFKRI